MAKVLRLNVYMYLPDDFDGDLGEAIGLYLAKRQEEKTLPDKRDVSCRVAPEPFYLNSRHGCTVVSEDGIWSDESRHWKRIDEPAFGLYEGQTWVK